MLRTIALTDESATGVPSGTFASTFSSVVLSDNGLVAFVGELQGDGVNASNNLGLFSGDPAALSLVARSGSQAPGVDAGVNFVGDFAELSINSQGQTSFTSSIVGPGVTFGDDSGLWSEGGGALALIAREGAAAVGLGPGAEYNSFFAGLELNDVGSNAFAAGLSGVPVSNNQAIFSEPSGALALLAQSGTQAPGAPAGALFQSFSGPLLSNTDHTAFRAMMTGGGVTSNDNQAIWSDRSGSLDLLYRTGDMAPGTVGDVVFEEFQDLALNNVDQVAIRALIDGTGIDASNGQGLWAESGGVLSLVTLSGDAAPGVAGAVFESFNPPAINDNGRIAFDASLTGAGVDGTNNRGIWVEDGISGLALVTQRGDAAPGTPAGVEFDNFSAPLLNDNDQVAFLGFLRGTGIDATNARGIWATDPFGVLQLIAREGDTLEVAPGEFREVSLLARPRATQLPGLSFSNLSEFAFWAEFTDGTAGVFVSELVAIPEPTAVLLMVAATTALAVRRIR